MKACRALDDRACATVKTRSQRSPKASRSQSLCDKTSPGCSSGVGGRGSHPRPRGPRQARRARGLGCSQLSPAHQPLGLPAPAEARGLARSWYPVVPGGGEGRGARARAHLLRESSDGQAGAHSPSPRPKRYRLEGCPTPRGSSEKGCPRSLMRVSPSQTQGVSDPRRAAAGTVSFLREAKAPPRLRPCNKCSPGSAGASPGLCTPGARSPR